MWKNKYELYEESVQSPPADISFIKKEYKKIYSSLPTVLREDFCGTGALLKEWVLQAPKNIAIGIDLDQEPITYGLTNHYSTLNADQQERMAYVRKNVLDSSRIKADVICAFNYSYNIFKERQQLLNYFKSVRKALNSKGLFFMDAFGGTDAMMELEEKRRLSSFTYYWECQSFNALNNECRYAIHFKKHGSTKKYKNVFTYDWRFWLVSELKDILRDAGFREIKTYWEGDSKDGGGNGIFKESSYAENCYSWLTYIVARP